MSYCRRLSPAVRNRAFALLAAGLAPVVAAFLFQNAESEVLLGGICR